MMKTRNITANGFSLVEMLITLLILAIVMTLASQVFVSVSNYSRIANSVTSATDKSRTAYDMMVSELALAGRGFKDLSHLDVRFDNGEGIAEMLMIENLTTTNGHSDITINFFGYDPTANANPSFLVGFDGNAPFVGAPILVSENANGELNQVEDNDLFLIYQYSALSNTSYFDGSSQESYWNIPDVKNSGVIVQLSPSGAPQLGINTGDGAADYELRMNYSNDGFLASGGQEWKTLDNLQDVSSLGNIMNDFFADGDGDKLGLVLTQDEATSLLIARKLGSSNSFNTIRFFVNPSNQLIREFNGAQQVLIDDVVSFEIEAGLDTFINAPGTVLASDLDGSVSTNTSFDPNARWVSDMTTDDEILLINRHTLALMVSLEVRSSQVDRTLTEVGAPDNRKRVAFQTQIRLSNNLPRGVFGVTP